CADEPPGVRERGRDIAWRPQDSDADRVADDDGEPEGDAEDLEQLGGAGRGFHGRTYDIWLRHDQPPATVARVLVLAEPRFRRREGREGAETAERFGRAPRGGVPAAPVWAGTRPHTVPGAALAVDRPRARDGVPR